MIAVKDRPVMRPAANDAENTAELLQAILTFITDQVDGGASLPEAVDQAVARMVREDLVLSWFEAYGQRAIQDWWRKVAADGRGAAFRLLAGVGGGNPRRSADSGSWNVPTLRSALGDDLWTIVRFKIDGEWVCYGDMRKHHVHAMVLRADERIGHFQAEKIFWSTVAKRFKTDEQPLRAVLTEEDHYRLRAQIGVSIGTGDVDVDAEVEQLED